MSLLQQLAAEAVLDNTEDVDDLDEEFCEARRVWRKYFEEFPALRNNDFGSRQYDVRGWYIKALRSVDPGVRVYLPASRVGEAWNTAKASWTPTQKAVLEMFTVRVVLKELGFSTAAVARCFPFLKEKIGMESHDLTPREWTTLIALELVPSLAYLTTNEFKPTTYEQACTHGSVYGCLPTQAWASSDDRYKHLWTRLLDRDPTAACKKEMHNLLCMTWHSDYEEVMDFLCNKSNEGLGSALYCGCKHVYDGGNGHKDVLNGNHFIYEMKRKGQDPTKRNYAVHINGLGLDDGRLSQALTSPPDLTGRQPTQEERIHTPVPTVFDTK